MEKQVIKLKVAIKSFGCQMNVYDTEVASGTLEHAGFEIVHEHESESTVGGAYSSPIKLNLLKPDADVILMNTCSVREHAEDRVFSRLGMLGKAKKTNPKLIVGLMGCMVEEHKEKLFKRFPQLDLMIGTRNIRELPALIEHVSKTRERVAKIKQDGLSIEYTDQIKRHGSFHAWLPIMTGCDKVCTFCIVPITRGAEVSMPAREVYREASRLVEEGVKWITLLGQNVNSYDGRHGTWDTSHVTENGKLKKENLTSGIRLQTSVSFPELLEMLAGINGLEKISFTTSHPSDATEELFHVIARNPKISRRFHLPLQSGSDRMLKRMKRLHTLAEYREKIDKLRAIVPEIAVTTDVIAGFSGESDEDHEATMQALREIRYDSAYIYKYSLRPGTPASKLPDDVPIKIKAERLDALQKLQQTVAREINRKLVGQTVGVLVESIGSKDDVKLVGLTDQEKKVLFPGQKTELGSSKNIRITEIAGETLLGEALVRYAC